MPKVPARSDKRTDPLDVFDDLRLGEHVRRARQAARDNARRARERAEQHVRELGLDPVGEQQTYSTIPPDGPNQLDTAPADALTAACDGAPTCLRCRCRVTPWEPPGGPRRWVCLGCGYDPERP